MGELIQGPWAPPDAPTLPILVLAQWEGVTVKTVRRWMKAGMPYETVDGTPRFNPTKVTAWLEDRRGRKAS